MSATYDDSGDGYFEDESVEFFIHDEQWRVVATYRQAPAPAYVPEPVIPPATTPVYGPANPRPQLGTQRPHALLYERYVYHARGTDGVSDVQGADQPILRQRFRYFRDETIQVPKLDDQGEPTAQTEPETVEIECFAPGTAPATPGEPVPPTGYTGYTRIKQETVYYIQSLRGDVVSLISEEAGGTGGESSANGDLPAIGAGQSSSNGARVIETVRYTSFGVPRVYRRALVCDIAHDDGSPLIRGVTRDPSSPNGGVTEGDYNLFFATFFDPVEENRWPCDIAADDMTQLQDGAPVGASVNNGVTEADYNVFFANIFNGGGIEQIELGGEWGQLSFPEHNNRIGYAGYWWDERVNMYVVRNRWYTPRTGRWLTPDPIGYAGGRNLYEYVGSRPWEFIDPWGLSRVLYPAMTPQQRQALHNGQSVGGERSVTTAWVQGFGQGASDGFLVTTNTAANSFTFGVVGQTREELAAQGMLYDADNPMLRGSEIAGTVMGETLKLAAFSAAAKLAECGTASGQAIKATLEIVAAYEAAGVAFEAADTAMEIARLIEAGDYEGAAKLAVEKGAELVLEAIVAKVTGKIADSIPCFVAGTEVHTADGPMAIELIAVGDRVETGEDVEIGGVLTSVEASPDASGAESAVTDRASWRQYTLAMGVEAAPQAARNATGSQKRTGTLTLLRPAAWLSEVASHQDARGLWVHLSIPEWDVQGLALVIAIDRCPVVKPGQGRIVTMKSVTDYEGELVKLKFVGDAQAIEGTASHPLFSEDRGDYVAMGTLKVGERVRTADGWAIVESLARRWSRETVYNIEVDGVHRYLVGEQRVVSHNAGPKKGCKPCPGDCDDGPTSWSAGRRQYWKGAAENAPEGKFAPGDLIRMRDGKPPLHPELGVPKELHHLVPQRDGGSHKPSNLLEVWPWEHDRIDPYRHYRGPRPDGE